MRTFRAAPTAYASAAALAGILVTLWMIAVRAGAPWQPVLVPLVGFLLAALWLSGHSLSIQGDELLLRLPFKEVRRVERHDIVSVEFAETSSSAAPSVLCIRTSGGEELRLRARVFSAQAVQCLLACQPAKPAAKEHRPSSTAFRRRV